MGFDALPLHLTKWSAARIGGRDKSSDACAADYIDGNTVGFKDAQDADVRNATCESASQRNSYARMAFFPAVSERTKRADRFVNEILRLTRRRFRRCFVVVIAVFRQPPPPENTSSEDPDIIYYTTQSEPGSRVAGPWFAIRNGLD